MTPPAPSTVARTNADLARQLLALAQQLQARGENPFKVRAYRRAADTITNLPSSLDREIRAGVDITHHPGIGKGIAAVLHEIVLEGTLAQLDNLIAAGPPELAAVRDYPLLDPKQYERAREKLGVQSIEELQAKLAAGEVARILGRRAEQHFLRALSESRQILLDDADALARPLQEFLTRDAGATRAEAAGAWRRRVEVLDEIGFLVETADFPGLVTRLASYSGGLEQLDVGSKHASFRLPAGVTLRVDRAAPENWGSAWIHTTGSAAHLRQLEAHHGPGSPGSSKSARFSDEAAAYRAAGLAWIPPELREGLDEVVLAAADRLPDLVTLDAIRGELHAHTTASDGAHSIEQMAATARARGDEYLGITDHSQSLRIAGGVSIAALRDQIRRIDRLNATGLGLRLLKSAEVDILPDGSLDYPDDLLAELDYTICSIHSKFHLGKTEQTERILRAMDHPAFNILGHATGRMLLRRPGYELDFERLIRHARAAGVCFEINASPDRLDLSAENARRVREAGIPIAICTDAHHFRELDNRHCGVDVARRAGLTARNVLNTLPLTSLLRKLRRR